MTSEKTEKRTRKSDITFVVPILSNPLNNDISNDKGSGSTSNL